MAASVQEEENVDREDIALVLQNFDVLRPSVRTRTLRLFNTLRYKPSTFGNIQTAEWLDADVTGRSQPFEVSTPDMYARYQAGGTALNDRGHAFSFGLYVQEAIRGIYTIKHASYFMFEAPAPAGTTSFIWNIDGAHWASKDGDYVGAEVDRYLRIAIYDVSTGHAFIDEYTPAYRGGRVGIPDNWKTPDAPLPIEAGNIVRILIACSSMWDSYRFGSDSGRTIARNTNYTFDPIEIVFSPSRESLEGIFNKSASVAPQQTRPKSR